MRSAGLLRVVGNFLGGCFSVGVVMNKVLVPIFIKKLLLLMLVFSYSCHRSGKSPAFVESRVSSSIIVHNIYFVRHAETQKNAGENNIEDAFSRHGLEQVTELEKDLGSRGIEFHRIYVSPLWRAQETIAGFLQENGYGSARDYVKESIRECCWDYGSDRSDEVRKAAAEIAEDLKGATSSQNVLIVGHYHSGKILLEELLNEKTSPENAKVLEFSLPVEEQSVAGNTVDEEYSCSLVGGKGTLGSGLEEVSGIAASVEDENLFYVHNDSGDGSKIYKINDQGKKQGLLELTDVDARDWEDISVGPCVDMSGNCIFIADIGNNKGDRNEFSIYSVRETKEVREAEFLEIPKEAYQVYSFTYPKGEGHNAEAFAVHPQGDWFIIKKTKGTDNTLYRFSNQESKDATTELEEICDFRDNIGNELVTAADIDSAGKRLLVRTYERIYEFAFSSGKANENFCRQQPKIYDHSEDQGEAITYRANSSLRGFITTSERKSGSQPIYTFECGSVGSNHADETYRYPTQGSIRVKNIGDGLVSGRSTHSQDNFSKPAKCEDIAPDNRYTCVEQAGWGKCDRDWMLKGNYCAKICGRCEE